MPSIYNSRNPFYKTPFGAVRAEEPVTFTLLVPQHFGCEAPRLVLNRDGFAPSLFVMQQKDSQGENTVFQLTLSLHDVGLYFYYFDLYVNYTKLFPNMDGEATLGWGESNARWQLTVYERSFETPETIKGGVMYQIFPDRFYEGVKNKPMPFSDRIYRADKNGQPYFWATEQVDGYLNMDYYGGDFAGIAEKLPYIASLGVDIIYLNPIFEAHSNHRYNTANYMKADPLLGTNDEFTALCKKAATFGIRIILDGVFSHTGSDSVYFNREGRYPGEGAWQSEYSRFRPWYFFSNSYRCGYRSWWGFETLPEVNEENADYRNFICGEGGVIDTWLQRGASGFRLDVADELPDDFIEEIRRAVKRGGDDKLLLGEVWEDATTKEAYGQRRSYLYGNGLDSVMNYPFKEALLAFLRGGDAADFARSIMTICENYPAPALHVLMNFISTHDTMRAITALTGEDCEGKDRYWQSTHSLTTLQKEVGKKLLRLAYTILFFLPGVPSIYYGDEVYMQGYKDPFNRGYYDWGCTDDTLRNTLTELSVMRHSCDAFKEGSLQFLVAYGSTFALERRSGARTAFLAVNRGSTPFNMQYHGENLVVPPHVSLTRIQ